MKLEIENFELAEEEHLQAALKKCDHFADQADTIKVFVQPRTPQTAPAYQHPGWIEYIIRIMFKSGCDLSIGCIQRKPGEPVEFHS